LNFPALFTPTLSRCLLYWVPHAILQVFIIILYKNVFQNPELLRTQVSLSPEQSTTGISR
jgi:hypothetical protein